MGKKDKKTYISLFSSAGVGCYGFKQNDFDCVATNELIERRLNIQKFNTKCSYDSGYIPGDITAPDVKAKLFNQIEFYKKKEQIKDIDVVIATPPCQGMSVANHKKTSYEIHRNSLVVEAIDIINEIKPKFFIFENVQAFMKTKCYDKGIQKTISEAIFDNLSRDYDYADKIMNFKNYGSNSSRTRTLVIGVRKDYSDEILPFELFPDYREEKTMRELIYDLPRLSQMGEISTGDIYHFFREYAPNMRPWIADIKEGESAYDNKDINKRPHTIVDGKIVLNVNKNGDKYKRQYWDKVPPCIHTRNDILASQNTVHPQDDRVFSIRELMTFMSIPSTFKWSELNEDELNTLSLEEKKAFLKKNDMNIRQSIGEAVPTAVLYNIAQKIKNYLDSEYLSDKEIKNQIKKNNLEKPENLIKFLKTNKEKYLPATLARFAELANTQRTENAAFYTDKKTLFQIYKKLPDIKNETIKILEPAVGVGNFLPMIAAKYGINKNLVIDVFDIDKFSLEVLKILYLNDGIPSNIKLNLYCKDFLLNESDTHYDIVIGNPPFKKITDKKLLKKYRETFNDFNANNISAFFLEKALTSADNVCLILPKYFLHNTDFAYARELTDKYKISNIIDFGEKGFKGVLIETICLIVNTRLKPQKTECFSVTHDYTNIIDQKELTDSKFPNWLIYRNKEFNKTASKMKFDIFNCFRDRQITNKNLVSDGQVWVIKSRNIKQDGSKIEHLKDYDSYLNSPDKNFSVMQFYERDDVFLSPNMTYYPRVIKKPKNTIVNGSVAILELKKNVKITDEDLKYFSGEEFREFYSIARNLSTRSLNIDKNSIYYFGKKR